MDRIITALKVQKRNHERVNVYLDEQFAFGLSRIVAAWLRVGQALNEEKIVSLLAEDSREVAYQLAVKLLSYRDHSEAEVCQYLQKKEIDDEIVGEVMDRLRRGGLVDDTRFARTWVENRSEFRPRGQRALQYELQRKGISREVIQHTLEETDDKAMAYRAALKQFRKLKNLEWPDFRQKMYAFLARRGFNYETSATITARVWNEQNAEPSLEDNLSYKEVDQ